MTLVGNTNNDWFPATVTAVIEESPTVKSFTFSTPHPINNLAGQHYELRLTAANGYQAARLYSAPRAGTGENQLNLTIMSVKGGEVSPYITNDLAVGDTVEIRGPFGKFFVWTSDDTAPVLLIGGGSGVVPLHAIFTAHRNSSSKSNMKMLYSSHTYEDILFKEDFLDSPDVIITLTKNTPSNWTGPAGRITPELLTKLVGKFDSLPSCYICGMSAFVDAVTDALLVAGVPANNIKTERFG